MSVRTDRAKEHARVHIGNHPYACERTQADGRIGWYVIPRSFPCAALQPVLMNARSPSSGATFLRKHDRNRHNAGADLLTCDAW